MTKKQYIQPENLFESKHFGFTQVVTSPPGTLVFISGQVGMDKSGKLVDKSDFAAQAEQALINLQSALGAAGASTRDVTMMRVYIVNYKPELAMKFGPIFAKHFSGDSYPAQTMVGVASLVMPDILIEIEAIAVIEQASE